MDLFTAHLFPAILNAKIIIQWLSCSTLSRVSEAPLRGWIADWASRLNTTRVNMGLSAWIIGRNLHQPIPVKRCNRALL